MRLGLRDPVHGADTGYQPMKFVHIGNLDFSDQVPCSVGGVHGGKAGIFTQGRDHAFDVPSGQFDHHDAADHVGGTMIFQPDGKACDHAGCDQALHTALHGSPRDTEDACERRDGGARIDTQLRD